MQVAAIEIPARFDRASENLTLVDSLLPKCAADLVLLPEASLTGYVSPEGNFDLTRFAEARDGPTARALSALAKKHATHLFGPLIERDGERVYNAMLGFDPSGAEILHYRKRHPWYPETWATPGDAPHPCITLLGMRVTIAICFDIHFDGLPDADVLLFPSAWVEDEGESLRPELLRQTNMNVVNANWGVGEPRIPGQGDSCIMHASGEVVPVSGSFAACRLRP